MNERHKDMTTHVYVAHLQTTKGPSWTSVHTTQESAELMLAEKALSWGHDQAWVTEKGFADLEDCPGIWSYGTSYLPIDGLT